MTATSSSWSAIQRCVLFTRRGVSELDVLDEAAVMEKYGIPPSRYADMAILRGDPSDEPPGVPGVGAKTAVELVRAYPSIEALTEDAEAERRSGAPRSAPRPASADPRGRSLLSRPCGRSCRSGPTSRSSLEEGSGTTPRSTGSPNR